MEITQKTKSDFIKLLSDYLRNKKSDISLSPELMHLADTHQLTPILYHQTKDASLRSSYLQAVSAYAKRKTILNQISEALVDIPYYTVKGITVSRYYPVPQLRTMGDCDIVVHECNKEKARDILLSMGFIDRTREWKEAEWHFSKQGLDFELHHRLLYNGVVNTEKEIEFADAAWDYVNNDHEIDEDFHFVFLLIHLKKHFLNRGVGLRQFMDLVVMSQRANLNQEKISTFLQQIELEKFAAVCSALCLRWFNNALPIDPIEISDEFYNKATDMIIADGVFGFEVAENSSKALLNRIDKYGKNQLIIRYIFPSYKSCSSMPKYKWIEGKPFFLPILWGYRILWALFSHKTKNSVAFINTITNSDYAILERNDLLTQWGLQ